VKKPKNPPGELIPLIWEGDPDALYVYGHVDAATFKAAVSDYYDCDDAIGFGRFPVLDEEPVHLWGRYCFGGSCDGETIRAMHTGKEKTRGAVPLTGASVSWDIRPRCDGYAGDRPCWIRKGHDGLCVDHETWWAGKEARRTERGEHIAKENA